MKREIRARVLVDNNTKSSLAPEWGLSVFIEYGDQRILLDTGASGLFAENAGELGIPVDQVDFGVLSHAHFDHGDGLERFFELNSRADFYVRKGVKENCYSRADSVIGRYIGIKKGILDAYADRIVYVDGAYSPAQGVTLLPHTTPGLEEIGRKAGLFVWENGGWKPDSFDHEQSLIFETDAGLVIFNSCSHGGADHVIQETAQAFPGKHIEALIGGFHLFRSEDSDVYALADRIRSTGIHRIYTGHCTGDRAMEILKREMGSSVEALYTGLEIVI